MKTDCEDYLLPDALSFFMRLILIPEAFSIALSMLPSDQLGLFIPLTPRIKYGAGFNPSPQGEREIKKPDFFKANCRITVATIEH
jgi:hypothetical protein